MPCLVDMSADPLLGLLSPLWQGLIGLCMALTVIVAAVRLARRGPSRMGAAMLIVAGAFVVLAVAGALTSR